MKKQNQSPAGNNLFKAILALETDDEAKRFFCDLLTPQEIREFTNRWQVAQMLKDKVLYSVIEKETGMSSTTIARVSKFLNGKFGGYRLILQRLKKNEGHHHHQNTKFEDGL